MKPLQKDSSLGSIRHMVIMIFGSRPMVSKVEEITPGIVTVAKDLGVLLYPCQTYNDHIASTVSGCMAAPRPD